MNIKESNSHFADKYFEEIDQLSETDNYFIPVIGDVAKQIDLRNAQVLDVGCGTGLFLKPLITAGCDKCYGVDGQNDFVDRAIARGYKEVRIVDDLNNSPIPFDDKSFDLVVCKDVFEHLLNPLHALSEINRVLKPEGFLLLHVPNHFPLIGRLKFLFTNDIDTFSFFKDDSRWTFPHIRFYEHQDMLKVVGKYGFILIADLSYHFPATPILSRFNIFSFFRKYLVKHFPNQFAAGFTFLVQKKQEYLP